MKQDREQLKALSQLSAAHDQVQEGEQPEFRHFPVSPGSRWDPCWKKASQNARFRWFCGAFS
jgi:hypothetical protein